MPEIKRIVWDEQGKHYYETGIDRVVLYPYNKTPLEISDPSYKTNYRNGVAWNGVTSVSESPSGADASPLYADNIKYLNLISAEEFGATIEAYTYPDEFRECNGEAVAVAGTLPEGETGTAGPSVVVGQQTRKAFGLSYRTVIGNDLVSNDWGYLLHLVYNATAAPSERGYTSINDSPEAISMSWTLSTTPVEVSGKKSTALLTINSHYTPAAKLKAIEDALYGVTASVDPVVEAVEPHLPMPDAVIEILSA